MSPRMNYSESERVILALFETLHELRALEDGLLEVLSRMTAPGCTYQAPDVGPNFGVTWRDVDSALRDTPDDEVPL